MSVVANSIFEVKLPIFSGIEYYHNSPIFLVGEGRPMISRIFYTWCLAVFFIILQILYTCIVEASHRYRIKAIEEDWTETAI